MLRGGKPPLERRSANTHLCGSSLTGQLPSEMFISGWGTASVCMLRGRKPPLERYSPSTYLWVPKAHPQLGNCPQLSNRLASSIAEGSQSPHTVSYVCAFRGEKPYSRTTRTPANQEIQLRDWNLHFTRRPAPHFTRRPAPHDPVQLRD